MINLKEGRRGFESIGNTYPVAGNVIREDVNIAGVRCAWFNPEGAGDDEIVFYIHGGAFIFGSIDSHAPLVSYIAKELNRKVLIIDYRLAPEHAFPMGLNDCVAVIESFCEKYPKLNFGLIGDSAGGNLTMAANLMLNKTNIPKPNYTILISPWVDLECKNESYQRNKHVDLILAREYLIEAAHLYAPSGDLSDPTLSPINGDFQGLSPVLIMCGTHEILEDDAILLHRRLLDSNVEAKLTLYEGEMHVWPFMKIHTEASIEALRDMADFANKHGKKESN